MRMLLSKTGHIIKSARDVIKYLNDGYAIRRNSELETVFRFIGLDGNLYNTNRDRCCHFKLEISNALDLFTDFHELEAYTISWIAFNNVHWNDNLILQYSPDAYKSFDNSNGEVQYRSTPLSPDFITNLYKDRLTDIWVYFDALLDPQFSVSNRMYLNLLLDDGMIIQERSGIIRTKFPELIPRIKAWQPVATMTSSAWPDQMTIASLLSAKHMSKE